MLAAQLEAANVAVNEAARLAQQLRVNQTELANTKGRLGESEAREAASSKDRLLPGLCWWLERNMPLGGYSVHAL